VQGKWQSTLVDAAMGNDDLKSHVGGPMQVIEA
jgi:hypothetical protein